MKHIRRKITLAVLGTMLLVFAALFATVNIFIPRYLTAEAQKAILSEDEHEAPVPFSDIKMIMTNRSIFDSECQIS